MGQIVAFIRTFKAAVDLVNSFYRHWVDYEIRKIKDEHRSISEAREAVIKQIDRARMERNSDDLISLNRALFIVESHLMQLKQDKGTKSP